MCENTNELATKLFNKLASRNFEDVDAVMEALVSEHPTNQASIIRSIALVLERYSKIRGDGRNQAAIDYAQNSVKSNKNNPIPYI